MDISNGKDKLISAFNTLPQVDDALFGWFQTVTFTLITKTIVDFELVETTVESSFYGVKQPMSPQELKMKPEGERSWKWYTIHATTELILKNDDIIIIEDTKFRVMKKLDYKEYAYVQYDVLEDYQ